jgi:NADH:ubiquinone oxidoreductase subunit E
MKGSPEIVELLQNAVAEYHLEDEVTLAGSFCIGKCNRIGVTVQVDDDVHTGVTKENFKEFFSENVLEKLGIERK